MLWVCNGGCSGAPRGVLHKCSEGAVMTFWGLLGGCSGGGYGTCPAKTARKVSEAALGVLGDHLEEIWRHLEDVS
eukprot:12427719-Karenia_brevis.AAC.1